MSNEQFLKDLTNRVLIDGLSSELKRVMESLFAKKWSWDAITHLMQTSIRKVAKRSGSLTENAMLAYVEQRRKDTGDPESGVNLADIKFLPEEP